MLRCHVILAKRAVCLGMSKLKGKKRVRKKYEKCMSDVNSYNSESADNVSIMKKLHYILSM